MLIIKTTDEQKHLYRYFHVDISDINIMTILIQNGGVHTVTKGELKIILYCT